MYQACMSIKTYVMLTQTYSVTISSNDSNRQIWSTHERPRAMLQKPSVETFIAFFARRHAQMNTIY